MILLFFGESKTVRQMIHMKYQVLLSLKKTTTKKNKQKQQQQFKGLSAENVISTLRNNQVIVQVSPYFTINIQRNILEQTVFVCSEVLRPSQPIRVMSSAVSLPDHTFSWAGLVL